MTPDSTDHSVVNALAASIQVLDTTRRVGWAKAFDAERKYEDLSRDLNIAKGDRAAFKRVASYIYGYCIEYLEGMGGGGGQGCRELAYVIKSEVILDPIYVVAGREHAQQVRAAYPLVVDDILISDERIREQRLKFEQVKRDEDKLFRQVFRRAKSRAISDLCKRYNLANESELITALAAWRLVRDQQD